MATEQTELFRGDPNLPGYLTTPQINKTATICVSNGMARIPDTIYAITTYQRSIIEPHVVSYLTQLSLACVDARWPAWFQGMVREGILGSDHRLPASNQRFYRQGILPAFKGERPMNLTDIIVLRCLSFNKVKAELTAKLQRIDCSWMLGQLNFPATENEVIRHKGTPLENIQAVSRASMGASGRCRARDPPKRDPVIYKVNKGGMVTVSQTILGDLDFTTSTKAMQDCDDKVVIVDGVVRPKPILDPVGGRKSQAIADMGDGISSVTGKSAISLTQGSFSKIAAASRPNMSATKEPVFLAFHGLKMCIVITLLLWAMYISLLFLRVIA